MEDNPPDRAGEHTDPGEIVRRFGRFLNNRKNRAFLAGIDDNAWQHRNYIRALAQSQLNASEERANGLAHLAWLKKNHRSVFDENFTKAEAANHTSPDGG